MLSLCRCCRLCLSPKQAQHQLHANRSCRFLHAACKSRLVRCRQRVVQAEMQLDNRELLVGDCLSLASFCLYKQVNSTSQRLSCTVQRRHHKANHLAWCMQITAIILTPNFPGWLAPMHFNPTRFEEFLSFAITVCGTWVGASWLVGGYKANATSGDTPVCHDTMSAAADYAFTAVSQQCLLHPRAVMTRPADKHEVNMYAATCHQDVCLVGPSPTTSSSQAMSLTHVALLHPPARPLHGLMATRSICHTCTLQRVAPCLQCSEWKLGRCRFANCTSTSQFHVAGESASGSSTAGAGDCSRRQVPRGCHQLCICPTSSCNR